MLYLFDSKYILWLCCGDVCNEVQHLLSRCILVAGAESKYRYEFLIIIIIYPEHKQIYNLNYTNYQA